MRRFINLIENTHVPSRQLIEAVETWINGWSFKNRLNVENKLFAVKDEAKLFCKKHNILYRGMGITKAQFSEIKEGKILSIDVNRLTSWTTSKLISDDYASGNESDVGLVVKKSDLSMILDVKAFIKYFESTDFTEEGTEADYIRFANREQEVVCEHAVPFLLSLKDIDTAYFINENGKSIK